MTLMLIFFWYWVLWLIPAVALHPECHVHILNCADIGLDRMNINALKIGIKEALEAALVDVPVFYRQPPPHDTQSPLVTYIINQVTPVDYMGGTSSDLVAILTVACFVDVDKGSIALRTLEQTTYSALHKQNFTATGFSNTSLWNMERRQVVVLNDTNLMACADLYQILGTED